MTLTATTGRRRLDAPRRGAWLLAAPVARVREFGAAGAGGRATGLVIPGFIANDRTRWARRALAEAGWRVHPWELGWNRGAHADTIGDLRRGSM